MNFSADDVVTEDGRSASQMWGGVWPAEVTVQAVDGWLCVDARPNRKAGPHQATRIVQVRIADIASIDVEALDQGHAKGVSKFGLVAFGLLGGLWNSSTRVAGQTGIMVTMADGTWFMLRQAAPAMVVKAQWAPLTSQAACSASA